jgi:cytoskeletal protein RodZ
MENRKFNLSKGKEPKGGKFNLSKETTPAASNGNSSPASKKSKGRLWLLLLVLVLAAIVFCVKKCSPDKEVDSSEAPIEQTTTSTENTQDTETENINDETVDVNVSEETSTPAASEDEAIQPENVIPSNETIEPAAQPVVEPTRSDTPTSPQGGNLDEKARQVIRGDFGNGAERKQNLGHEYNAIQQRVNEMYRNDEVE